MNLPVMPPPHNAKRVPRASGDEPYSAGEDYDGALVFPAPAGMNRSRPDSSAPISGVPRASGDEPGIMLIGRALLLCSPRQRG